MQGALVGLSRSSYYHEPPSGIESEENLALMRVIDELYLKRPFYGAPRMTHWLMEIGYRVNHKRVERLTRLWGLSRRWRDPWATYESSTPGASGVSIPASAVGPCETTWSPSL
ncbi:MAG: transposase [Candidatus Abyssobacteria bacterium SURF_5]|uniref:Transposase n=1 Tax=Abyssobacteria bacterium (strain SURF_5) TaxID=2093360 RepID=A0A3A4NM15_ABYX5|nr:MAG: transposase [Candidatus Abyssubacteria bacterium SURF_5]